MSSKNTFKSQMSRTLTRLIIVIIKQWVRISNHYEANVLGQLHLNFKVNCQTTHTYMYICVCIYIRVLFWF